MHNAVRSYVSAGVALAGVGAIAFSPVVPIPDVEVPAISSSAVELNALVNPIELFVPIFEKAFADTGALGQRVFANPAPILEQILANQVASAQTLGEIAGVFGESFQTAFAAAPGLLETAFDQFAAGEITLALNTLFDLALSPVIGPLLDSIFMGDGVLQDLVGVLQKPLVNAQNVIGLLGDPDFLLTIGLLPLQTAYALNTAVGGAAEALLAAAEAGDPEGFVNAITTGSANVTAAVLDLLLNPGTPPYNYDQGLVAALLSARDMIAQAIGAPAPSPALLATVSSEVTDPALTTITLDVAPASDAIEAPKPAAETDDSAVSLSADAVEATEPATAVAEETAAVEAGVDEVVAESKVVTTKKSDPLNELRKGVEGAVNDIRNGFKHAAASLTGKASKPAKSESSPASDSGSASESDSGSDSGSGSVSDSTSGDAE